MPKSEEKEKKVKVVGPNPDDYPDYGDFVKAKREFEAKKAKKVKE